MFWLQWFRIAVFAWVVLCALIVLGISGHIISVTEKYLGGYLVYTALGIATAVLSIATIPTMFLLDFFLSSTPFTSWVVIEIAWLSILWVLWLATGADAASATSDCSQIDQITIDNPVYNALKAGCHETQALEAFAFLAWLALLAYTIALLVVAILAASRGARAWTTSVSEFDLPPTLATKQTFAPQYPMGTVQGAPATAQQPAEVGAEGPNPYRAAEQV